MDNITYDDIYEIAAEVAEETITKFLQNLVKLVPSAEDTVDNIQASQYEELKQLRKAVNPKAAKSSAPLIPVDDEEDTDPETAFYEQQDQEFAQIAHGKPKTLQESMNIDDALSKIPLERSDLFGQASHSEVDNSQVVPNGQVF